MALIQYRTGTLQLELQQGKLVVVSPPSAALDLDAELAAAALAGALPTPLAELLAVIREELGSRSLDEIARDLAAIAPASSFSVNEVRKLKSPSQLAVLGQLAPAKMREAWQRIAAARR